MNLVNYISIPVMSSTPGLDGTNKTDKTDQSYTLSAPKDKRPFMLMTSGWVPTQQRNYKKQQRIGTTNWQHKYAEEQGKNGSNESFKRTDNATITDYSG